MEREVKGDDGFEYVTTPTKFPARKAVYGLPEAPLVLRDAEDRLCGVIVPHVDDILIAGQGLTNSIEDGFETVAWTADGGDDSRKDMA